MVAASRFFLFLNFRPNSLKDWCNCGGVLSCTYMALSCRGTGDTVKEFTFLLSHVLYVSHPAALEWSTHYARKIVDRFFQDKTQIDSRHSEHHNYKFHILVVESRLEIAFVGRPRGFNVPDYKICKYEHSECFGGSVWSRDRPH